MLKNRKGSFLDLNALIVLGAFTVLLLHILGFFVEAQNMYPWHPQIEAISIILLRFGRSLFVFVTGMLLFYWYKHRPVDWRKFWQKRWFSIILPYMIWTGIYTIVTYKTFDPTVLLQEFVHSLVTGSSFYHLYYIPVFLQLNLLFMLSKSFLERYLRFPLLVVIMLLQMGIYSFFTYLFVTPGVPGIDWNHSAGTALLHHLYVNGQTYVFNYLFYFMLGAYAGLYVDTWRKWVYRLRYVSFLLLLLMSGVLIGRYVTGQVTYLEGLNIFHPLYLLYTLSFITFLYPISRSLGHHPVVKERLSGLAKHNMAIYLVHPLVLFLLESYVIFRLPFSVPALFVLMFVVSVPMSIWLFTHTSPTFWRRGTQTRSRRNRPLYRTQHPA
jgi:hypothetical protein